MRRAKNRVARWRRGISFLAICLTVHAARTFTARVLLPSAESFELVARQPVHGPFLQQRLPAQCKAELGNRRVAREIHRGRVFITGPVIALLGVILLLRLAPFGRMPSEFYAGAYRECGNPDASETEVIGAIVVTGAGFGVRLNGEAESLGRLLDGGIERSAFRA